MLKYQRQLFAVFASRRYVAFPETFSLYGAIVLSTYLSVHTDIPLVPLSLLKVILEIIKSAVVVDELELDEDLSVDVLGELQEDEELDVFPVDELDVVELDEFLLELELVVELEVFPVDELFSDELEVDVDVELSSFELDKFVVVELESSKLLEISDELISLELLSSYK